MKNGKIIQMKHYTCNSCPEIFDSLVELNKHKKAHGKNRFKCPQCDKWCADRTKLKTHLVSHQTEKKFSCNLCDQSYKHKNNLDRHVRITHYNEKKYLCHFCDKRFSQHNVLKAHLYVHIESPYVCDLCHRSFHSKGHLRMHKNLPSCQHRIVRKVKKNQNIKTVSPRKTYRNQRKVLLCPFCGKVSLSFSSHIYHVRTHTGEKPYECSICKKTFPSSQSLRVHNRIHTDERPYACDQCPLTFRQNPHLHMHKLIHSGERPHKCPVCQKSFVLRGNLNVHMRLHTGEMPYQCTLCTKRFTNIHSFKRHKLFHANDVGGEDKNATESLVIEMM